MHCHFVQPRLFCVISILSHLNVCINYACVWMHVQMSVQEFSANSTVLDLLKRSGRASSRLTTYRFPLKEELRPRLNHKPVSDPNSKLKMGDVIELTPAIPDKSLTEYREEIQRMYDRGLTVSSMGTAASTMAGSRSWPVLLDFTSIPTWNYLVTVMYIEIFVQNNCVTTLNLANLIQLCAEWLILCSWSNGPDKLITSHPLWF